MTVVEIITPTERIAPAFPDVPRRVPIERLAGEFLVGYRNPETRRGYETDLRIWFEFCSDMGIDPYEARRSHFSLFMHQRETIAGNSPATINRKMTSLTSFYQWLVDEEYLDRNAAKRAPRPIVPQDSSRDWLTGVELARCVTAAEFEGGDTYALICLLAFCVYGVPERHCSLPATHVVVGVTDAGPYRPERHEARLECCLEHANYYARGWLHPHLLYPGVRGAVWIEPMHQAAA